MAPCLEILYFESILFSIAKSGKHYLQKSSASQISCNIMYRNSDFSANSAGRSAGNPLFRKKIPLQRMQRDLQQFSYSGLSG